MKIFITGGTGFLGRALVTTLVQRGHQVTILTRAGQHPPSSLGIAYISGDPARPGQWQMAVPSHDVVINLAGATIFRRWTPAYRHVIRDSRIQTTSNIVKALAQSSRPGQTLINGSAVGYYGFCNDTVLDENSPAGTDFLATLVHDWETAATAARQYDIRVVLCRFGVILGRDGGALDRMLSIFRWGLGSPLGSGRQWFSWISMDDVVGSLVFALEQPGVSGPVNCTAPAPVTNKELTLKLGKAVHRPVLLPSIPPWLVRLIMGEFGSVLLEGQRVAPVCLRQHGFTFKHPTIDSALRDLLRN